MATVHAGLASNPKKLPAMYMYDAIGDAAFIEIMNSKAYYLARAEMDIFALQHESIFQAMIGQRAGLHLVELGAGDGSKTAELLKHFVSMIGHRRLVYTPNDISHNAIDILSSQMAAVPGLHFVPHIGSWDHVLSGIKRVDNLPVVVALLGSTIGNFSEEELHDFMQRTCQQLIPGDKLFVGYDLIKDPRKIMAAYDYSEINDSLAFGALRRCNAELDANFCLDRFIRHCKYDPITGKLDHFAVSLDASVVVVGNKNYILKACEPIHLACSNKFSIEMINAIGKKAGLGVAQVFHNEEHAYCNVLYVKEAEIPQQYEGML